MKGKINMSITSPFLNISKMEEILLKNSSVDDISVSTSVKQEPTKKLTAEEVKQDVSILARLLIRAYVGWPVLNIFIKRKVLKQLIDIYNNACNTTSLEFFNSIKSVIGCIPDNHISMSFNGVKAITTKRKKHKNVGANISQNADISFKMLKNNIAIIGFKRMVRTDEFNDTIEAFINETLKKSTALIIDLRGNSGGNSTYSDKFANYLCGTKIDSFRKLYVRATPEAQKIQQQSSPNAFWAGLPESEDFILFREGKNYSIDKNKAYMKPIYILTDRITGSSAEMFLLRMIHHPCVKVVGDNSAGMETFGNMGSAFLKNSQIKVFIGLNYRVLVKDNFELNGYEPDIKCDEGKDALEVALADIDKNLLLQQAMIYSGRNK